MEGESPNGPSSSLFALEERQFLLLLPPPCHPPLSVSLSRRLVTITTALTNSGQSPGCAKRWRKGAHVNPTCTSKSPHTVTHALDSFNLRVINCSRKQLCHRCAEGDEIETRLGDSGTLSKGEKHPGGPSL